MSNSENDMATDADGQMYLWRCPSEDGKYFEMLVDFGSKNTRIPIGTIRTSLKEWRRDSDGAGDEFLDLLTMAEQLLDDLEYHQSNGALLETAMERQDKEIMFLRKRLANLTEQRTAKEGSD